MQYEERRFELRAANEEECEKWMYSISFLRESLKNRHETRTNQIKITVETDNTKSGELSNKL